MCALNTIRKKSDDFLLTVMCAEWKISVKKTNTYFYLMPMLILSLFFFTLTAHAQGILSADFAVSSSCQLTDSKTITLSCTFPENPICDDNMLYVYALSPFVYDIPANAQPIQTLSVSASPVFTFSLYDESGNTRLYQKFAVGVKSNGSIIMISHPQYITNPELLATNTRPRQNRALKSVQGTNFWNVELSRHDYFESSVTTIQLMNSNSDGIYTNPLARSYARATDTHPGLSFYYMPNAAEADGVKALAASCTAYAKDGNVENFILGNEVNVRKWNYMTWTDWDSYVREYSQAFRVAYNAIKSVNANAHVFVCIDLSWDRNRPTSHSEYYEYMDAKDFLTSFNNKIRQEGNIDWSIAHHPYPAPLTCSLFWNDSVGGDVPYCHAQVKSNKLVTFENLSVLTDFMQTPDMLSPTGNVRHLILSEIGLTNAQGEEVQAAALCASYVAAEQNPYVEEIIYLLSDCEAGVNTTLSGKSLDMFQKMDSAEANTYREWAKAFIGIQDWSQVLR